MTRAAVLAVLLAASVVAGCGRKGEAPAPTPDAAKAQTEVERRQGL